jgi:hypothetical protein
MEKRKQKGRTYKKLHRWPGLIISFLLLYFGFTGIIMNHREFFAPIDINRKFLPAEYAYKNWNNSSFKGNISIAPDSVLIFGNLGIWLTDSLFERFVPFENGLPKGSDKRKTFDILKTNNGHLYAATQFGLYVYEWEKKQWEKFDLDVSIKRFTAVECVNDTVYAINRSYLFRGKSNGNKTNFEKIELEAPIGFINEVTLFKTIWQIHSGEIFGLPGKLFVDLLGLVTIFLSITGIIYFFFPGIIVKRVKQGKQFIKMARINRWSLKWHNHIGEWTFVLLVVLYFTGMFLRPPMLIAIANSRVKPIKHSHLDQPNPWYDKLRDLLWDDQTQRFLMSTSEGMFYFNKSLNRPEPFNIQPPISVMGINVFEPYTDGAFLIGSFSGLFLWHPNSLNIYDFATGEPYAGPGDGRPVGNFKVTGMLTDHNKNRFMVDYDQGAIPLWHKATAPQMPQSIIENSNISLWNFSLEMHTGRLFNFILGSFYILIVPLTSLAGVVVVISGYLLWRKKYRRKKKKLDINKSIA